MGAGGFERLGRMPRVLIAVLAALAVLAAELVAVSTSAYAVSVPGAPTALAGAAGNAQVALTWTAPASNGGAAITDYVVQFKLSAGSSWTTFADGTSTAPSATVTGLTNASAYSFQVAATNSAGTGTFSTAAAATPHTMAPGAPGSLVATSGNAQVGLTWAAPTSTGGASITDYQVQFKLTSGSTWTTFSDGVSTSTSGTITGLSNGSSYDTRVAAINSVGTGTYSSTATATAHVMVAGAPTGLNATAGNTQLGLTWTAPASNGGAAITDYQVQFKLTSGSTWTTFTDGVSTGTSATVTGLVNGSSYDARVAAINSAGTGGYSGTATTTPRTVPGTPTALTATGTNGRLGLTWTAPASTGGAAISDYQVQYKLTSGSTWTTFADAVSAVTSADITGLSNGSSYDVRVAAINAAGTGATSATATAIPHIVIAQPPAWSTTVSMSPATVSSFAGSGSGSSGATDGTGSAATFEYSQGMHIVGGFGYVTDNGRLRKINLSTGAVTTLIAKISNSCADSTNPAPGIGTTDELSDDGTYLYWLDTCSASRTSLRQMELNSGVVSTIAVLPPSYMPLNLASLTVGPGGTVYVGFNNEIDRVNTTTGAFTTMVTLPIPTGMSTVVVRALAADSTKLWATESGDCTSVTGTCTAVVSLNPTTWASTQLPGTLHLETAPGAVYSNAQLVSAGDYLYTQAGVGEQVMRLTKASGAWVDVAGSTQSGYQDGTGSQAWLSTVGGIDTDGVALWINDTYNFRIRKLVPGTALSTTQPSRYSTTLTIGPGQVSTLAGSGSGSSGATDGTGSAATFEYSQGMHVVGGFGYVTDNRRLRKINLATGAVSTVIAQTGSNCADSDNIGNAKVGAASDELADDGTYLYWLDTCATSRTSLRRMDLSTGAVSTIGLLPPPYLPVTYASLAVGPGGILYVAYQNEIDRVDTVNGTFTTAVTLSTPSEMSSMSVRQLTADSTRLWATIAGPCTVGTATCTALISIDPTTATVATLQTAVPDTSLHNEGPLVSAGNYLYGEIRGQFQRYNPATNTTVLDGFTGIGRWNKITSELTTVTDPAGGLLGADGHQLDFSALDVSGSSLYLNSLYSYKIYEVKYAPPLPPSTVGGSNPSAISDPQRCTCHPVDLDSGAQFDATTDLQIPGRGVPLSFTRTYDTRTATTAGRLGYGWHDSYDWHLSVDTTTGTQTSGNVTIRQDNGSESTFYPPVSDGTTTPGYRPAAGILSDLVHNSDNTWTYTVRQTLRYTFDAQGRLTGIRDLNGYLTALTYDGNGNLSTVTEQAGRTLTFGFDTSNRIHTITDPMSRVLTYTYDTNGDLTQVTNLAGGHWDMTYAAHLLTVMSDPRTNTVNTTYTGTKVTQQSDLRGKTTLFDYGTMGSDGSHTTTVTRPTGAIDTYSYVRGQALSETKGVGTPEASTTSYTYDPTTNAVASITNNDQKTTTYTYDSRGNQLTSLDPLNRATSATYNGFDEPLTQTDASNVVTTMTYDGAGRLKTISRPLLGTTPLQTMTTTYTYGDSTHPGDLTAVQDANLKTSQFAYDTYGNQTSVTDATARKTTSTYNVLGWKTATVSPEGNKAGGTPTAHTTSYTNFTGAGQPQTVTDALLHPVTYGYDNNGNITDVTDTPDSGTRHTVTTYNPDNMATQVSINGVMISTTAYDDDGNVHITGDGRAQLTTYDRDALGRVRLVTDPLTHTTTYGYNTAGDQTTVKDGELNTITTSLFDADHEVTRTTDSENRVTSYGYDALGHLITVIPGPVDNTTDRVTKTTYDSLGRRTKTEQGTTAQMAASALSTVSAWTYDAVGNVLTSTDGANATTTYTRDDAGRTYTIQDPLLRVTTLDYDQDGNQTTTTRPGTIITTSAYDADGQLTGIDHPAGTPDVGYAYDAAGLRKSMIDGTGTTTYTYNPRGQVLTSTKGTTSIGYGYDAAGRQTSVTYPGNHTVTRGYDDADRLHTVTDWASRITTYDWNNDNTLNKATLPNGVSTTYGYDTTNLTTKITATTSTATVSDLRYTYDNTTLLSDVQDLTTATTPIDHGYTWDTRARLATATSTTSAPNTGTYAFDAANRLTGALGSTYTPDAAGQLTNSTTPAIGATPAKTATYTYNALGNRTQTVTTPAGSAATTRTYGYDGGDNLTSYGDTAVAGVNIAYTYDGNGLRAGRTRTAPGPVTTSNTCTWDTSGSLPVLLSDGDNYYLYGADDHPYAQINTTTGATTYLQADIDGSTIASTDTTGNRTGTWTYDSYGNITNHTGTANTLYTFAGEYRDVDTGLTYLRARDYDPATGSFTTRDPLESITNTPYAFTNGNPLQDSDPTGQITWGGGFSSAWSATSDLGAGIYNTVSHPNSILDGFETTYNEAGGGFQGRVAIFNQFNPIAPLVGGLGAASIDFQNGNAYCGIYSLTGSAEQTALFFLPIKLRTPGAVRATEGMSPLQRVRAIRGDDSGAVQFGSNPGRLSNSQATQMASRVGFHYTGRILRGERVFTDGKRWIVQDTTSHIGGTWKMAKRFEELNSKEIRSGTYDHNLNPMGR